jgi:hypothetical protein
VLVKHKVILPAVALLIALLMCPTIRAQFDVRLSPILLELDLAPGAKKTFQVFLSNENPTEAVSIRAYPGEMIQEKAGTYAIYEEGKPEFSCSDWITIKEPNLTMAPGSTVVVNAEIKAPRDVYGGRYAALIFEVIPKEAAADERRVASVSYSFKMPTFIEVTIRRFGGVVKKLEIVDFKAEPITNPAMLRKVGKNSMAFSATVKNEGNTHVKAKGTLLLKTKEGKRKRQVPLGSGRGIVLPGASLDFKSILKKPEPGEYVAHATIRYGNPSPALAEVPFTVGAKTTTPEEFKAASFLALRVRPEEIVQQTPAGGFRYINMIFRSQEAESVFVDSRIMAMEYDERGNLSLVDAADITRSCASWLKLEPRSFVVPPGKTKNIKLVASIPKELSGGYYACLVFDASTRGTEATPLAAPFEIPILFNLPTGAELKGEISQVEVSASRNNPADVEVLFENTGNTHVKPKGKLVLKFLPPLVLPEGIEYAGERKYQIVGETDFSEISEYVLPGEVRRLDVTFPAKLPLGEYLAEITIRYGGDSVAKSEKKFIIK